MSDLMRTPSSRRKQRLVRLALIGITLTPVLLMAAIAVTVNHHRAISPARSHHARYGAVLERCHFNDHWSSFTFTVRGSDRVFIYDDRGDGSCAILREGDKVDIQYVDDEKPRTPVSVLKYTLSHEK